MEFKFYFRAEDIRESCIEYGWYTMGYNEDYSSMLLEADGWHSADDIAWIARDIVEKSDPEVIADQLDERDLEDAEKFVLDVLLLNARAQVR